MLDRELLDMMIKELVTVFRFVVLAVLLGVLICT